MSESEIIEHLSVCATICTVVTIIALVLWSGIKACAEYEAAEQQQHNERYKLCIANGGTFMTNFNSDVCVAKNATLNNH